MVEKWWKELGRRELVGESCGEETGGRKLMGENGEMMICVTWRVTAARCFVFVVVSFMCLCFILFCFVLCFVRSVLLLFLLFVFVLCIIVFVSVIAFVCFCLFLFRYMFCFRICFVFS